MARSPAAGRAPRVFAAQVNRELAQQIQQLARVNLAKFAALNRLYIGLLTLVILTAGLMTLIAYESLSR